MTDLLPPPPPPSSDLGAPPPPVRDPSASVGARDVTKTAVAALAAVIVAVLVRAIFDLHSPLVLIALAYATFLAVTVISSSEVARWRRSLPEARTTAPRAPAVDRAAFARPPDLDLDQTDPEAEIPGPPAIEPEPEIPGVFDDDPDHDAPRWVRTLGETDAWQVGAAVAGALAFTLLLRFVLDWGGLMSTVAMAYLAFLVLYFALLWDHTGQEAASDRIVTVFVWTTGFLVLAGLTWMLGLLLVKGLPRLRPSFFTEDLSTVGPNDPGGGAFHAIVGTFEQVGMAVVVVVPIAVLTAVYLNELKGRMAPLIRFVVDAMSGLPSIVAGLLVFTVWVNGRGFSGTAGAAALVILMLPTVTRTSEEILRTIPDNLREASLALGAPQWRVVMRVVVPTALTGLVTAVILGIARAIGETAPMLLTAFGSDVTSYNPSAGPQSDLPLFIWKLIRVPNEVQQQRAWTGALVLVLLVLILFVTARVISNRARKRLGRAR